MKLIRIAILLVLPLALVQAQSNSSLTGVVTDPSGGVVPGAEITVVNSDTNQKRTATTDSQGRYSFQQMQPSTYQVSARGTGFSEVVVNDVHLLVNTPSTVDIHFAVGAVQQSVSVTADTTQVNTQDATLGNAIGTRPILELPFDARNVIGLLSIQPGVTYFGDPSQRDDYRSGSVNGGKSDQGNVTLDGVDVNDEQFRTAFTSVLRTTLDSVQEFRTTTTNGGADVGRSSGAQVALVTKSGTNSINGSLYEYTRNTDTSANSFFNNEDGIARQQLDPQRFRCFDRRPHQEEQAFLLLELRRTQGRQSGHRGPGCSKHAFPPGNFHVPDNERVKRGTHSVADSADRSPAHR